jgi:hypothetical protein
MMRSNIHRILGSELSGIFFVLIVLLFIKRTRKPCTFVSGFCTFKITKKVQKVSNIFNNIMDVSRTRGILFVIFQELGFQLRALHLLLR